MEADMTTDQNMEDSDASKMTELKKRPPPMNDGSQMMKVQRTESDQHLGIETEKLKRNLESIQQEMSNSPESMQQENTIQLDEDPHTARKGVNRKKRVPRLTTQELFSNLKSKFSGKMLEILVSELDKESVSSHTQHDFLTYCQVKDYFQLRNNCNRTTLRLICRSRGIKSSSNVKDVLAGKLSNNIPGEIYAQYEKDIKRGMQAKRISDIAIDEEIQDQIAQEQNRNGNSITVADTMTAKAKRSIPGHIANDLRSMLLEISQRQQLILETIKEKQISTVSHLSGLKIKIEMVRDSITHYERAYETVKEKLQQDSENEELLQEEKNVRDKIASLKRDHDQLVQEIQDTPIVDKPVQL